MMTCVPVGALWISCHGSASFVWLAVFNSHFGGLFRVPKTQRNLLVLHLLGSAQLKGPFLLRPWCMGSCGLGSLVTALACRLRTQGRAPAGLPATAGGGSWTGPSRLPLLHPSQCFTWQIAFPYPFPLHFQIIPYRNNPEPSHTWSFWSWRKGPWNTPPPDGILCEMRASLPVRMSPLFGQNPSPTRPGFLWGLEAAFAKSKEKEVCVSEEFPWLWSKAEPRRRQHRCSNTGQIVSVFLLCFHKGNRKSECSRYVRNWKKHWWQTSCPGPLTRRRWASRWTVEMTPKIGIR